MTRPMVSVLTTCYNQEQYIRMAMYGVERQRTVFEVEHIVIDDGSTDCTAHRAEKYACVLRLRPHLGIMPTYIFGFSACRGKYIAICDADDYWTDALKLQKQVDYMEAHPRCAACFTAVEVRDDDGRPLYVAAGGRADYELFLRGGAPLMSPGVMFRADLIMPLLNLIERKRFFIWDYPLYLYLAWFYQVACLSDVTAVYRKLPESFSNTRRRGRRLRYVLGIVRIRWYFMLKFGCKPSTVLWVLYRFTRDMLSIVLRRWYK